VQKSDLQNFSLRQKSSNVEIISFAQLYYIVFLFFCQEEDYPRVRSDLGANSSRKGKLPGFIPALAEIFGTQGQHILSTRA
jgi:hypothetical protein